ncbi:MAG: hypothetical protein RLY43_896 [Bacteroidota bacterium]|jgi:UDP-2,3-diacylglucosamine pyrophosphatase LpxH
MDYTFYTDTHIGSKYLQMDILPKTIEQIAKENAYTLGDIYELKNCEYPEYPGLLRKFSEYKKLFFGRYLVGNHEIDRGLTPKHLIIDGHICLVHGDYILWGDKKALEFRNEKPAQGSGFIQRMLAKRNGSISNSEAKDLANYANRLGCDVIVCGHVHVKHVFDEDKNGVRVISLPRGKTEITI